MKINLKDCEKLSLIMQKLVSLTQNFFDLQRNMIKYANFFVNLFARRSN